MNRRTMMWDYVKELFGKCSKPADIAVTLSAKAIWPVVGLLGFIMLLGGVWDALKAELHRGETGLYQIKQSILFEYTPQFICQVIEPGNGRPTLGMAAIFGGLALLLIGIGQYRHVVNYFRQEGYLTFPTRQAMYLRSSIRSPNSSGIFCLTVTAIILIDAIQPISVVGLFFVCLIFYVMTDLPQAYRKNKASS